MAGSFLDPVGDAAFMVPVVGEARYAGWLARAGETAGVAGRLGVTAGVGAVRAAAGGGILTGAEALTDPDATLGDVATSTLQNALLGAIMHTGLSFRSDVLGDRFLHLPEGAQAIADANVHDNAVRAAAAQMADGQPVEVRPVFDVARMSRRDLFGTTAVDRLRPSYLDEAVARANGQPSEEAMRDADLADEARRTPVEKVVADQTADAEAQIEDLRAQGLLTPEEESELAALAPPEEKAAAEEVERPAEAEAAAEAPRPVEEPSAAEEPGEASPQIVPGAAAGLPPPEGFVEPTLTNARLLHQLAVEGDREGVEGGIGVYENGLPRDRDPGAAAYGRRLLDAMGEAQTEGAPLPEEPDEFPVADKVTEALERGETISGKDLQDMAGESLASGKIGRDDLYDAAELGINRYIRKHADEFSPAVEKGEALATAKRLEDLKNQLPTQTVRAGEKDALQQFSTPPDYAYAAAWAARLEPRDVVLEPSAGTGSLATHALNAGAREVHVNDISERRAAMLRSLRPTAVTMENAEHIHSTLPGRVAPTVVLMNPPFSAAATRGIKSNDVGAKHMEEALRRLEPGGRLVAIVGGNMGNGR